MLPTFCDGYDYTWHDKQGVFHVVLNESRPLTLTALFYWG